MKWLATSPYASLLKILTGAALGGLLSWLMAADVSPLMVAIGSAVIPVAINWLNPDDPRYGKGSQPHYQDQANRPEFEIEGEN
jgi:hypothetical protein